MSGSEWPWSDHTWLPRTILRVLKVPPGPTLPTPSPGGEVGERHGDTALFQPAIGFRRYRLLQWGLRQLGGALGLTFGLGLLAVGGKGASGWVNEVLEHSGPVRDLVIPWVTRLELIALATFLAQIPVTLVMVLLDYELRWYELAERSLRIREGIFRIRQQTMSYANIQNLSIRQGPLQRFLGIADLEVRTAGGGDAKATSDDGSEVNMHLGYFRGVGNAAEIRDRVLERIRRHKDAGLGDLKEASESPVRPAEAVGVGVGVAEAQGEAGLVAAAQEVLGEVRALGDSLAKTRRG